MSLLDWFEWNGVKSSTKISSLHVTTLPRYLVAKERVETVKVPGRSGTLTILEGDNVYDEITHECECIIDNPDDIPALAQWLRGSGTVKFANRPDGYFKARIANQIAFDKVLLGNPHRKFKVQFRCFEPYFYLDIGNKVAKAFSTSTAYVVGDLCIRSSTLYRCKAAHSAGSWNSSHFETFSNPGNVPCKPLIKVTGSNPASSSDDKSGTVTIAGHPMVVANWDNNVSYIYLDCEAKVAYKGSRSTPNDPLTLLTNRISGEWIEIPDGDSTIQIATTGRVSGVEVTPRWRYNV